jgi:3-hydroxyisobutyrate dehydrogenase/glyoxylate/succinic semialdehyde reductase
MQKDLHLATVSAYESGVAMPLTNVAKEIYELAMRDGHDTEDFSAVYEYLSSDSDIATIDQKSPALAKAQLHQN